MADREVYAGAVAPEALRITVTPGTSGLNLATVSAVSAQVLAPNGTTATWAFSIESQSSTVLVAAHQFAADNTDVPTPVALRIFPSLTIPAGVRRCEPFNLYVVR